MVPYNEGEYARTRLLDTVVRYAGKAIRVVRISRGVVGFIYLSDNTEGTCRLAELDINPVELGYVNTYHGAYYSTRIPMRRDWRQGLRNNTLRIISNEHHLLVDYSWADIARTIEGKFPSFKECLDKVKHLPSAAFSRNFALDNEKKIIYKGKWVVGSYEPDGRYILLPKFDWVRENLEEEYLDEAA